MLSSHSHSMGRLTQRCERTACVGSRGVSMGLATLAIVMAEGKGVCLLTVAVLMLGGTETAQHALE